MFTFGVRIILLLLIIGGAIAIIGDYIGRAIGRRRLTIFNLRPRHTAFAVTILTGILIVFMTMGIILVVSRDARTALFGLEELRKDLADTKKELAVRIAEKEKVEVERTKVESDLASAKNNLKRAKTEIAALEKTKEKLGKEVEASRKGTVLFRVDEVLLSSVIQAGPEKKKLEEGLKQILSAADAYVRGFGVKKSGHLIFISPEDFNQAIETLQNRKDENIVQVAAKRNTLFGEEVPIYFKVMENKLVYRGGKEIAEIDIAAGLSTPEIEQEVKRLLYETHRSAKEAGVLPDPSGSVGSVPYSKILALAKKIKSYAKGIKLKTLAATDTYTLGPLEITFKILYQ